MKKYAYKVAFACFDCQKSFKRQMSLTANNPDTMVCPNCACEAVNLGRHFKPPRSIDSKQWKKVKVLYHNGFRFQRIYLRDPDHPNTILNQSVPYPKNLAGVKEFITTYKRYALETNLNKDDS